MNFLKPKLREGDYVENLSKTEFDLLIAIENHNFKIPYYESYSGILYCEGMLNYTEGSRSFLKKRELSYKKFKRRAKNTFNENN